MSLVHFSAKMGLGFSGLTPYFGKIFTSLDFIMSGALPLLNCNRKSTWGGVGVDTSMADSAHLCTCSLDAAMC